MRDSAKTRHAQARERCLFALTLAALLLGCGQHGNPTRPGMETGGQVTMGQIHNDLLESIYASLDVAKAATGRLDQTMKDAVAIEAVNGITDSYGLERMDQREILASIERGRMMARQDPVRMLSGLLDSSEQEWWDRYSVDANVGNAREVYVRHCELYGRSDPDGTLGRLLDVGISSAEFWHGHRGDQQPVYRNPFIPDSADKSLLKTILKYTVCCTVDAGAAILAGTGATAAGGPVAGAVAAAVVGGLASYGADDILFGD